MKDALIWLAVAFVVFTALAVVFAKSADRPGDDFGAIAPALLCGGVALLCLAAEIVILFIYLMTH